MGLALGVVIVGLPLGGRALVNLDLIALGDLGVPDSLVGLGPEIPRRAPLQAVWALLSPPLGAVAVTQVWMILIVAVAVTGTVHLTRGIRYPLRLAAGLAYGASPFVLTRLAVGHLGLATAAALLPWAFETLTRPLDDRRRTLVWSGAFALCGYFGLIVAGPALAVGFVLHRRAPDLRLLAALVATQVPWLIPALASAGAAGGAAGAGSFDSHVESVADAIRLVVGFGFWRSSNQLGSESAWGVLVALLLVLVAVTGHRLGGSRDRAALALLALLGLAVTAASTVPGVADAYDEITSIAVLAPLREGQRLLVFTVLAVLVFAARGADALIEGRSSGVGVGAGALLGAAAISLVASSFWGLDGAARAHAVPDSWEAAAALVDADPGVTLALPWSQYFDVTLADGRRGHNPVPFLIGGDVISRHDLGLDGEERVSRDGREDDAATLVRSLRFGEPIDEQLRALGIRWIVAIPDLGTDDIERLRESPAVEVALDRPEITVFSGPGGAGELLTRWRATSWLIVGADVAWVAAAGTVIVRRKTPDTVLTSGVKCV